ncbi:MAG: hypothetical protein HQL67_09090 [Magnetococcales bacterium]|nr:hypothetical protein [Magnetococcales bacterium]
MVPVAHYLSKDSGNQVHYYISRPRIVPQKDFRLQFLSQADNVFIHDIWSISASGYFEKVLRWLWRVIDLKKSFFRKTVPLISSRYLRFFPWDEAIQPLLTTINPDVVCFDYTKIDRQGPPNVQGPIYGFGGIARYIKAKSIPVISLPHGLWLCTFDHIASKRDHMNQFDRIIVDSTIGYQEMVKSGLPEEKLFLVGASRFDPAWIKQLGQILPPPPPQYKTKKFIITFFASNLFYNFDFKGLIEWLQRVASNDNVLLVIQPHSRGQSARTFRQLSRTTNILIDEETSSPVLIRLSNAVSTIMSSVVVEGISLGKPLLYPKFLQDRSINFEEKGVCLTVENQESTEEIIEQLVAGWQPDQKNVDRFLSEDVYGGGGENTIERVAKLLS